MDSLMFGHTLRMLRTTAGISLRTLAKKIDVSPAYLSQVELGKLPPPTHNRITTIAETIGIPVSMLIEMSQRPNPEVILLADALYGVTPDSVAARPGWDVIIAVQNGAIYPVDPNSMSVPGPRLVDALEETAALIHPELFE